MGHTSFIEHPVEQHHSHQSVFGVHCLFETVLFAFKFEEFVNLAYIKMEKNHRL
jgi:hypothetical protein